MSSVCATTELTTHVETPAILTEPPQERSAHLGFWRTLVCRLTAHIPHAVHVRPAPMHMARRRFETPMDQLVVEHPSLSVYVLATI
jgi:hypothetical protein